LPGNAQVERPQGRYPQPGDLAIAGWEAGAGKVIQSKALKGLKQKPAKIEDFVRGDNIVAAEEWVEAYPHHSREFFACLVFLWLERLF